MKVQPNINLTELERRALSLVLGHPAPQPARLEEVQGWIENLVSDTLNLAIDDLASVADYMAAENGLSDAQREQWQRTTTLLEKATG